MLPGLVFGLSQGQVVREDEAGESHLWGGQVLWGQDCCLAALLYANPTHPLLCLDRPHLRGRILGLAGGMQTPGRNDNERSRRTLRWEGFAEPALTSLHFQPAVLSFSGKGRAIGMVMPSGLALAPGEK